MKILLLVAALAVAAVDADAKPRKPAQASVQKAKRGSARAAAPKLPALPGPAFPTYRSPAEIQSACERGLTEAGQRVAALEQRAPDAGWLRASDELNAFVEDAANPIDFLSNVHPERPMRDAAQACALRWAEFLSALGQNEALYRAARQVEPADAIDREYLRAALQSFEDSGVGLPPEPRARAKAINDRIADLGQQFEKNVRDDGTQVAFTPAELRGVPEAVWKNARRDEQGRVLLSLAYPQYFPVMQAAEDPAARERMWRAKTGEGGEANLQILGEIARLRREYAQLFGYASYDDFTLRRRMAEKTDKVLGFLDEVKAAVAGAEQRELQELREAKARHLKLPVQEVRLERWDLQFYTERLRRERFDVDQEAFRPHFPPQASLKFALRVVEKMMGVRYQRVPAKLWHPEAQAYAVSDAATGKPLATLLVDLYPREGKYNHAAVFSYRNGSTLLGRVPQAALVVNFDRNGLTLDELETLLHELGHAVHNNLSATRYASQGGTQTLRDFVEAPSQMLEEWVYDPKVLRTFAEVCPVCKRVPEDLLAKARAAKDYGKGVKFARQHLYASYDIALHGSDAPEPMGLWARMEGDTPLGYVAGTQFPAGFAHLASGYAAGYYGYLWSLVVAMDLRTQFEPDKLDPKVGRRYRDIVLANGGQRPPQELVREFLGREPSSKAFYDYLRE
ncbi:MAG: M3 family metallopeptidase [Pseudomonadota bacterium]